MLILLFPGIGGGRHASLVDPDTLPLRIRPDDADYEGTSNRYPDLRNVGRLESNGLKSNTVSLY